MTGTPPYSEPEMSSKPSNDTQIVIDINTSQTIDQGFASRVQKVQIVESSLNSALSPEGWIAIKSAPTSKKVTPEPHDIVKEVRLLSNISHVNIIRLLHSSRNSSQASLEFWMPWIPFHLTDLLDSPKFTPHEPPSQIKHLILSHPSAENDGADLFVVLVKSIVYQILLGIDYLHNLPSPIAHRDIKPGNVLISRLGCVQLIDFGIAYEERDKSSPEPSGDIWPESASRMYNEVGTGPFRSPELLFGARSYDARATDLWSLGATLSSLFTPVQVTYARPDEDDDYDYDSFEEGPGPKPQALDGFLLCADVKSLSLVTSRWSRTSLFKGNRGDLGLAWSIFQIRGTPNDSLWPTFKDLPDANRIQFRDVPPSDLKKSLLNLPSESTSTVLDLIEQFLVYEPSERLQARKALEHPWFRAEPPLVLPETYPVNQGSTPWETTWKSQNIGYWLKIMLR